MIQNPDTGEWEDLGNTSYENTDRVKAHILTLTGEDNLSGARNTFKKRSTGQTGGATRQRRQRCLADQPYGAPTAHQHPVNLKNKCQFDG